MGSRSQPAAGKASPGRVLYGASAVQTMGHGTIFVLLAGLRDAHDLPTWGLGAIGGASFAAMFIAQLTLARFADRGHTSLMLRVGLVLPAAGMAWFAVGTELWQFIAARVLIGLGSGMFRPAASRLLVTRYPDRPGEALGRLASVDVAGFVLGPPMAAAAAALLGLRAPFLIQGCLLLAAAALLGSVGGEVTSQAALSGSVRALLSIPSVQASLLLAAGAQFSVGVFESTWSVFFEDHGASTTMVAATMSLFPLPIIALAPIAGRYSDRVGPARAGIRALVWSVPVLLAYALFDPLPILFSVAMAQGIADAFLVPASQSAMAAAAPPSQLAAGQGLYGAVGAATAGFASVGGAAAYDLWGGSAMWGLVALAVAALTVATAGANARSRRLAQLPAVAPTELLPREV